MERFTVDDLKEHIMLEDEDILVLHKPAGIAVQHASFGQMDLESAIKTYLARNSSGRQIPFLGIIHRLDQPVEGILVFAKSKDAARKLNSQLTSGKMEKRYLAVVEGRCRAEEETLRDFLVKDGRTHSSSVADEGVKGAKEAKLTYHLLEQREQEALVEICLMTGRHHQIRVQMAHAGMPLSGDHRYNPGTKERTIRLCAFSLTFFHPRTGRKTAVRIPEERLAECYRSKA